MKALADPAKIPGLRRIVVELAEDEPWSERTTSVVSWSSLEHLTGQAIGEESFDESKIFVIIWKC